ncbi:MAG: HepT-like ribonuclease domain-containing protein, partial [Cyanobacteria bacterium P01_H01_bin.15]
LSQGTRDIAPDVPWKQIIGMRSVLAHTYFDIDLDAVWIAVFVNIPVLKPQITELLNRLP